MKVNEKDMFDVIIPLDSHEDILIGRVDSSTGLADELYSADIKVLIIYFFDSSFQFINLSKNKQDDRRDFWKFLLFKLNGSL